MTCTAVLHFWGPRKPEIFPETLVHLYQHRAQVHWRTFDCANQTVGLSASSQTPPQDAVPMARSRAAYA